MAVVDRRRAPRVVIRKGTSCAPRALPLVALAVILVATTALSGCTRRQPHGIAERYLENLQQFNYAECYNLLSQQDRAERSFHEFLTEVPLGPDVSPLWFRPILHVSRYELGPERRNPDGVTADVPVRITVPDLPLWERTLDASAADGNGGDSAEHSLRRADYPKRAYDDRIFLIKEHHHWRVVAGFGERDRIVDRHREVMADYYAGHYDKVVPIYQSMIAELERQRATSSLGLAARYREELAQITKIIEGRPISAAYVRKLKLSGVEMKMSEARVPAIFGTITNSGGKPVDDVELTVTWYLGRGKDLKVAHREEHPAVLTPIEFTDFSRPVMPLVPGETRDFAFILTAPTAVQQSASPYVAVSTIALTQASAPLPKTGLAGINGSTNTPAAVPSMLAPEAEPPGSAVGRPPAVPKPRRSPESATATGKSGD